MFDKYVDKTLEFKRKKCRELVPTSPLNAVISLCMLLDTFATNEFGVSYYYTIHCTLYIVLHIQNLILHVHSNNVHSYGLIIRCG